MRRTVGVLVAWATGVAAYALVFGGGAVAPCLGLSGSRAQVDCVARWQAANPPPGPLVDPALPWLWLGIWIVGSLAILSVARLSRR